MGNFVEVDEFTTPIAEILGSDPRNAATYNARFQAVINRTKALKGAAFINGTTINDYAGVNIETDPAGEINITNGTFASIPSTPLQLVLPCKAGDVFYLDSRLQLLHLSGSSSNARVLLYVIYPGGADEMLRDSIRESINGSADNALHERTPSSLVAMADDGFLTVELLAEKLSGTVHLYGPAQLNAVRARVF